MKNKTILSLIIILGIILGGFYLASKTDNQSDNTSETATTTESMLLDTSDWKIYHNEKYGFEIKHPENFEIKDRLNSNNDTCDFVDFNNEDFTQKARALEENLDLEDIILGFRVYMNPDSDCERKFTNRNSEISGGELISKLLDSEEVIINDYTFTKNIYLGHTIEPEYENDNPYRFSIWQSTAGNTKYIFFYKHRRVDENPNLEEEFKNILSTFKVID